jgi:hypothetical protein
LVSPPEITAPGTTFPDMTGHPARTAVEALAERGILNGFSDGQFHPGDTMTRAQFAAVVVRALGLSPQTTAQFSDVAPGDWCAAWVGAAYAWGIVRGRTDTVFDPGGTITVQEAAVMVSRAAKLCGLDTAVTDPEAVLASFDGGAAVGLWAREDVAFCCREGLLTEKTLEPSRPVLRGEVARMVYALLDRTELL